MNLTNMIVKAFAIETAVEKVAVKKINETKVEAKKTYLEIIKQVNEGIEQGKATRKAIQSQN